MNRAIASAGKDGIGVALCRILRLAGCGAGRGGLNYLNAMLKSGKRQDDLTDLLRAAMPVAARCGVVNEDEVHATILRGLSRIDLRHLRITGPYPAFSVSSAQRA